MHTPDPITLTQVLATYAAIISSIGLGWNLYRDLRDRAKLKVSASICRLAVDGQGSWVAITSAVKMAGTNQRYVVMSVVNVGRRPIVWKGWGGKYRKRTNGTQFGILDTAIKNHLPKRLQEGDEHSVCIEFEDGFFENVKSFFMWDASGKKRKLSWWQLRKLRAEARKAA
ncbi:MAG: hypothetical protein DMG52_30935 [Acidobacteria bacterium]|nr:MAG: hypothetical protein DMG52_30935 [Acidobacteriota bacterium]